MARRARPAEIADRLADRPEFTLIALDEARRKDDAARAEAINAPMS
jgi:N-acetyl-gamma-glutamyl-phosphate reductase